MDKKQKTDLLEEAAMIFLAVSEDPDDPELIEERDRFLNRSELHRQIYEKVQDGWRVSGGRSRSVLPMLVPLLIAIGLASYLSWEPLRIYMLADISTDRQAEQNTLSSGDLAYLDAKSAIIDETESGTRKIRLLRGSAFFDVEPDERPFVVQAGNAEITVVGTAFETSFLPDGMSVSVAEGVVDVSSGGLTWRLLAGEQLYWPESSGAEERSIEVSNVASWRGAQLIVEDMTIRQVADILERRVSGGVLIMGGSWADARVSGTFDLDDPDTALRTLAVIGNARLISGAPIATILLPKNQKASE